MTPGLAIEKTIFMKKFNLNEEIAGIKTRTIIKKISDASLIFLSLKEHSHDRKETEILGSQNIVPMVTVSSAGLIESNVPPSDASTNSLLMKSW